MAEESYVFSGGVCGIFELKGGAEISTGWKAPRTNTHGEEKRGAKYSHVCD